ncbi:MAG: nucleotidyltransferase family protein [Armatimonadetes bacterium]|nr:nucleotidyltransferase family protein [Armatimonadota bacterium]
MCDSGVAAIILAAGGSTRLGRPKQLLSFGGETLVARVVRIVQAASFAPVVLVTGANAPEVEAATGASGVVAAFNPDWQAGMGGSIRTGVVALLAVNAPFDAVLLLVCDQPFVSEELLRRLCDTRESTGATIVASEYGGTWGVPCLFDKTVLPELAALDGASGARAIIERHRRSGDAVAVSFPEGVADVDTPADWERLGGVWRE